MDADLLAEAKAVSRRLDRHLQMTLPSVLAEGERFTLRITVFGPDALPDETFEGRLDLSASQGIEGLPAAITLGPADRGVAEVSDLVARGPEVARVVAQLNDWPPVRSNPAWVTADPATRVFWGDLHIHTLYSDCQWWACKSPEFAYAYARDLAHLDFAAAADHLRGMPTDKARWPRLQELTRQLDAPGRFVPILAFESSHRVGFGGDNNAYFLGSDAPYFWVDRDDMHGNSPAVPLQDLWAFLDEAETPYMTVPHHTGRRTKYRDFSDPVYDPKREPLFEIYSAWGSSERHDSTFSLHAGMTDRPAYFVDALTRGCRYGVIASSDDHTTLPGGESRNWGSPFGPRVQSGWHHMGLAAVRATALTREALWEAMWARRTWGTTFDRTLLDLAIGDLGMGEAAEVAPSDPLRKARQIRLRFSLHHHAEAQAVLVRNGEDLARERATWDREADGVEEVVFTDPEPLEEAAVRDAPFHPDPFVAYYVRLELPNKETQWTSPVWLDL